jgi:hypothetical protein
MYRAYKARRIGQSGVPHAEESGRRFVVHLVLKTKMGMPPTFFACGTEMHFRMVTET